MSHTHKYGKDKYHCDVCGHHKQIAGTDAEAYKGVGMFMFIVFIVLPVLVGGCSALLS